MTDLNEVVAIPEIDPRRDMYDTYLDFNWAQEQSVRVPTPLQAAFNSLCLAWKEAANTHRHPHLATIQMTAFAGAYQREHMPKGGRLVDALKARLLHEMGDSLNRAQKKKLEAVVRQIDREQKNAGVNEPVEYPISLHWRKMLGCSEIQLSITGSQSLAFCAQLFAYESFVTACFEGLGGDPKKRIAFEPFWNDLAVRLGRDPLIDNPRKAYWDEPVISTAREVRNSIAHRNGKVKLEELRADHGFYISPMGIVSVKPCNNRELYGVLKEAVTKLIDEVAKKLAERKQPVK